MPKFKNSNATFFSNFQTFKVAKKCLDYLDLKALLYSTFAVSQMMLMSLRLQFPSSSWNTSPSSMQARPLAFKRNFLTPAESHEMQITFTFAKILHFRSSIIAYILWKFQTLESLSDPFSQTASVSISVYTYTKKSQKDLEGQNSTKKAISLE